MEKEYTLEEALEEIKTIKNLGTSGIVPRWKAIDKVVEVVENSISKDEIRKIINKNSYINSKGNRMFPEDCYENFCKDIVKLLNFKIIEDK